MEDLIQRALNFAAKAHETQKRKFNNQPYIIHPIGVAEFVALSKESKNKDILLAVAILHDVIEDTAFDYKTIEFLFGYKVADLVKELTNNKKLAKLEGKKDYLLRKMIGMSSYALVIKLADILHNLIDLKNTPETFRNNFINRTMFIIEQLPQYRMITSSQKKLIKMIQIKLIELEQ